MYVYGFMCVDLELGLGFERLLGWVCVAGVEVEVFIMYS